MSQNSVEVDNQTHVGEMKPSIKLLLFTGLSFPPLLLWLLRRRGYAIISILLIILSFFFAMVYSSQNNWPLPIWVFPLHVVVYMATAYYLNKRISNDAGELNPIKIMAIFWAIMFTMLFVWQILFNSLFSRYGIASVSMNPALIQGDYVITRPYAENNSMLWPSRQGLARGDVVIFKHPQEQETYVKRIVAMAGEKVSFDGNMLRINGDEVGRNLVKSNTNDKPFRWLASELYVERNNGKEYVISLTSESAQISGEIEIPPGHVFVMGDNRNQSIDSRFWGTLPVTQIVEKPVFVWWSVKPGMHPIVRWQRLGRWIN